MTAFDRITERFAVRRVAVDPRVFSALLPWVVFAAADRLGGVGISLAAVAALVTSAAQLVLGRRRSAPVAMSVAGVVIFGSLLAASMWPSMHAVMSTYGRSISAGALGVGLLASGGPAYLTSGYVHVATPPSRWDDESVRLGSSHLSRDLGFLLVVIATSFTIGSALSGPLATTLFNWLVPILVVTVSLSRSLSVEEDDGDQLLGAIDALTGLPTSSSTPSRPRLVR